MFSCMRYISKVSFEILLINIDLIFDNLKRLKMQNADKIIKGLQSLFQCKILSDNKPIFRPNAFVIVINKIFKDTEIEKARKLCLALLQNEEP